ncbi:MAG: hypothetical protein ACTSWA_07400 [Candidatus Thorarchaeota archaeon]
MVGNLDFEANALVSVENYLKTVQSLNEANILSSKEACKTTLNTVVQVFSYALEVYKSFLLGASRTTNEKNNMDSLGSITFRFVESMKILNDSFFLSLTGRYPISRILERVAIESLIKGIFYYGCVIKDVSTCIQNKNKNWIEFMKIVQKTKIEHPTASPLALEDYVSDKLQKSNNVRHAGLKQMIIQLHAWELILQDFEDINEFIQSFKIAYRSLSEFIHSTLHSTYTYIERTTQNELRVFWGAQFSRDDLEKESQEIIMCVDFLLSLVLSALSSYSISEEGIEHLTNIQNKFAFLRESLVIAYQSTELFLSRSSKLRG